VLKAMARDPDARFATAAQLCGALDGIDLRHVDVEDVRDATVGFRVDDPTPAPSSSITPKFADSERTWLVPAALIVVVALTLAIVGLSLSGNDVGRTLFDAVTPDRDDDGGALSIAPPLRSFDPFGSGGEHDDELVFATDGDPNTAWTTERYRSRQLGGLKPGVGIVIPLTEVTALERIELDSPTKGWSAQIYLADAPATEVEGWGDPVAGAGNIDGGARISLRGARGGAVLVWITDLGDGSVGERFAAAIAEIRVFSS